MAKVSVIIGVYNCANTLQEALDSIYAQTYKDYEIIICDDGSSDETLRIVKENALIHPNVKVICNDCNMGLNYTLNHCLQYVHTEFVARMDGDDISLPERFDKEVSFLESHPEYAVVSAPMIYFDEGGEFRRGKGNGEVLKTSFIHGTPICHAPSMSRTEVIKSVGCYSVSDKLLRVEDYHLWFKIFAAGYKLYMLDECLYKMRDDRNAKARRNWKSRKNQFYVMNEGFSMIGLPWYYRVFAFRPLLTYLVPSWLYDIIHRRK